MEQFSVLGNQQERREGAIRLAAFFEGEGSFIVTYTDRKNGHSNCAPVIRMGNCDPRTVEEMQRILNLHNIGSYVYLQKKYKPGHAQCAVLSIAGFKRCSSFLEAFGEFFFARKSGNIKLWQKYFPLLAKEHLVRNTRAGANLKWRAIAKEFSNANKELNRLGISRFLNDYTPNAIKSEDIVSSDDESVS